MANTMVKEFKLTAKPLAEITVRNVDYYPVHFARILYEWWQAADKKILQLMSILYINISNPTSPRRKI